MKTSNNGNPIGHIYFSKNSYFTYKRFNWPENLKYFPLHRNFDFSKKISK